MPATDLSREEYESVFKAELDEIKEQINVLIEKHGENDSISDLKEKEEKARLKLRELRKSSEEDWDSIKSDLENSYDALNKAISNHH